MNPHEFSEWYKSWCDKAATRKALALLEEIGGDERDFEITRNRILKACFHAAHYDPDKDPGNIRRKKVAEEKKRRTQLAKAAHILARSAENNDATLSDAMSFAESESGVRVTRAEKPGPMAHHLVAAKYFSALKKGLEIPLPPYYDFKQLQAVSVGNLIFDKIIFGRRVTTHTMLAFELTFYLRLHTAGRAKDSPQRGQRMPDKDVGNPCRPVVATFCEAALGLGLVDAAQISDNVSKLKDVGLFKWPESD